MTLRHPLLLITFLSLSLPACLGQKSTQSSAPPVAKKQVSPPSDDENTEQNPETKLNNTTRPGPTTPGPTTPSESERSIVGICSYYTTFEGNAYPSPGNCTGTCSQHDGLFLAHLETPDIDDTAKLIRGNYLDGMVNFCAGTESPTASVAHYEIRYLYDDGSCGDEAITLNYGPDAQGNPTSDKVEKYAFSFDEICRNR